MTDLQRIITTLQCSVERFSSFQLIVLVLKLFFKSLKLYYFIESN